jgi:hypothetical protein
MKKLLTLVAVFMMAVCASAQDEQLTIFVEKFVNNSSQKDILVRNLHEAIISGLSGTGRLIVIDAGNYVGKPLPKERRDRVKALGEKFDYFLEGTLNSVTSKHVSNKNGSYYSATSNFTLILTDPHTGIEKVRKVYSSESTGGTDEEAILESVTSASGYMKRFVEDNFKVEAVVKGLDDVDLKKNVVKTCYVSIGEDMGIAKGQIFEVFANIEVLGEPVRKKVAELKCDEVLSGTMSHCSVKSGGDLIKKYFDEGITLTVISRARKQSILSGIGL